MSLPIGMITLLVMGVLIYFGLAQRILDRMRLTDKQALVFIAAIIVGSFIDIPIAAAPIAVSVNVGGALLPAVLALWLIAKAGAAKERVRAMLAAVLVAIAVWLGSRYLPYEPENMFLDPKLIYGIAAGLIAYIAGRSRRSAFIGAVLGIVISDVVHYFTLLSLAVPGSTDIGGAGAFDVVIIAGLVAVMVAELVGETREKLQGGPELGSHRPAGLYEFSRELQPHNVKTAEKEQQVTAKQDDHPETKDGEDDV